jgi:acid phosphatase class B
MLLSLQLQINQLKDKKEMTTKIKIGIVGSRSYTNKKKIKDLLHEIKEKYGDEVEIVSGGQSQGARGRRALSQAHGD